MPDCLCEDEADLVGNMGKRSLVLRQPLAHREVGMGLGLFSPGAAEGAAAKAGRVGAGGARRQTSAHEERAALGKDRRTLLPKDPGSDFCSLTHLVKLDLSKNRLQQLPVDFGRLVSLQHLDLLNNRLVTLPVSFAQLKNLKWLDLKDNPLDPVLAKVAGDCLDEKQCKQAAVRVLQHMKVIQSEQDQERQRKLQAEREMEKKREAEQRAREAQERELRKREKAEEKERRRREYDAQRAAKQEMEKKTKKETVQTRKPASSSRPPQPARHKHSWSRSVLRALLLVLLCILCTLAVCKLTELQHQPLCVSVNALYEDVVAAVQNHKTLQNMLQQNSQQ